MLLLLCLPCHKGSAQGTNAISYAFCNTYIHPDSTRIAYLKPPRSRPKGTIGTIVGVSMLAAGFALNEVATPANGLSSGALLLLVAGSPTTVISGIILLSHLGDNKRYSMYVGSGKAGLAYNF